MVTLDDILAARDRIADVARVTPVIASRRLTELAGVPVFVKCEQLQRTGSFKVRGALNVVRSLPLGAAPGGLVAASAGNHAQGVALAGAARGLSVTVVMPAYAPLAKVNAARDYGASVVLHGQSLEEARVRAREIADAEQRLLVPPFDNDDVIAGQGTLGLEVLDQVPEVTEVLVPAGGGGLLAGVAVAVKALAPHVRVVGVQSAAMDGVRESFEAGRVLAVPPARTIADGVAVAGPSARTFALIERHVDAVVAVPEDAIANAIVFLIERAKLIAEGAGALTVAALLSGAYRPSGPCVAVISGGNLDINLLGAVVRRGLVDAGRYQRLTIEVGDTPGQLALVTAALAEAGANVLEVEHVREIPGLPVGIAAVQLLIEVDGPAHSLAVEKLLGLRGITQSGGHHFLATEEARRWHALA